MVLFFSNGKATVKIVVHADDIQVSFKGDAFSVSDGTKQFQVTPGSHALHVSSGGFEFDTDNFTLKRGDNPTLTVERDNGEVTAKLGDRVIGTRPSPGAPARLAQENKTKKSNEPAKTDLDSIATGKWERGISEEQFELTGNATWRLNTAVVRDVVLRADCHKAEDGNVNLWVREVHPNGRTAYVGWYDGQTNGKVGIAIGRDGNWSELVTPVDIVRPEGREFVNVAMSAVGDTLSMYIDGQRVLSAQNAEFTEGTLQVGAFGGRQQFKNVEYQLLNSAPSSASPAPQD